MIEIKDKVECCGCESCASVCPKQCIDMQADKEGFLYPVVDKSKCVNCEKCEKICPVINKYERKSVMLAYALQVKDNILRLESSSGGAFSAISNYIFSNNGVVYGVIFDSSMNVVHSRATSKEELKAMRGSKYVQSRIGDIYKEVKKDLINNIIVCFSGTPCQIEGLLNFLGKNYENLITIDLVCHGVPSPKVWKKYANEIEKKYNSKISSYSFRSKRTGFHDFGTEILLENGEIVYTHDNGQKKDFMHLAFFAEICSRPSCHDCKFKTAERRSDFTLFDCWHVSEFDSKMEDDLGTSAVFIHSKKAHEIFEKIKDSTNFCQINVRKIIELDGNNIEYSMKPNSNRKEFFDNIEDMSIDELELKFLQPPKK